LEESTSLPQRPAFGHAPRPASVPRLNLAAVALHADQEGSEEEEDEELEDREDEDFEDQAEEEEELPEAFYECELAQDRKAGGTGSSTSSTRAASTPPRKAVTPTPPFTRGPTPPLRGAGEAGSPIPAAHIRIAKLG